MDLKKEELYTQLTDGLDHLVKVYRNLLDVVRKEKEILVSAKLDDLNENNKSKDTILVRIRSLENSRMKCARDLALVVGADVDAPRLLDIATFFEPERADKLRNMHSVLELLVRRVSEVNKQNEELVQSALKNITGAMEAIRDTLQPKPTYARQGSMVPQKSDAAGNLVRREV
jgi:flagellar biosynthesis/type III secretory pathway chaperone